MSIPVYVPEQSGGGINIPVYIPQNGGMIPVYHPQEGGRSSRSGGLGISRRFQSLTGFLKAPMERAKETIVNTAVSTAKGVLQDALDGKELKQALRDRTTEAAMDLKTKAEQEASKTLSLKRSMTQKGSGSPKKKKKKRRHVVQPYVKIRHDLFE